MNKEQQETAQWFIDESNRILTDEYAVGTLFIKYKSNDFAKIVNRMTAKEYAELTDMPEEAFELYLGAYINYAPNQLSVSMIDLAFKNTLKKVMKDAIKHCLS